MIFIYAVSCLLYFTAMIVALTWKGSSVKILLCLSLFFSFITSLIGVVINLLVKTELGRNIIQYIRIFSYFSSIVHMFSVILLLVFLIMARNYYVPKDNYNYEN